MTPENKNLTFFRKKIRFYKKKIRFAIFGISRQ